MIDLPQIVKTTAVDIAVIHVTCARNEIQKVMGPGLKELREVLAEQGGAAAGPWFTHHLKMPGAEFDFEIGIPVKSPITASRRVTSGQLPAGTVARTIYHGPYDGLGGAWKEFSAWIAGQNRKTGPTLLETYLTDPASTPNSSEYQTELTRPLLD